MTAIALAGRRIDAAGSTPARFPLQSVPIVTARVRELFARVSPAALVCSAACGADLIALEVAEECGIATQVVLPFEPDRFFVESVRDRPGAWEARYRRAIARAQDRGHLEIVAGPCETNDDAYRVVTDRILDGAVGLGGGASGVLAVAVVEGGPRGDGDLTWRLIQGAKRIGIAVETVSTLPEEVT